MLRASKPDHVVTDATETVCQRLPHASRYPTPPLIRFPGWVVAPRSHAGSHSRPHRTANAAVRAFRSGSRRSRGSCPSIGSVQASALASQAELRKSPSGPKLQVTDRLRQRGLAPLYCPLGKVRADAFIGTLCAGRNRRHSSRSPTFHSGASFEVQALTGCDDSFGNDRPAAA